MRLSLREYLEIIKLADPKSYVKLAAYDLTKQELKYSPVSIDETVLVKKDCDDLFNARIALTKPKKINFKINKTPAAKETTEYPFVVVSSRRAAVIKAKLGQADAVNQLFYDPARTGNRQVFIVVDQREYDTYKTELADKAHIFVVGCDISSDEVRPDNVAAEQMFGFGINRFCAVLFMRKHMPDKVGWWMIDDTLSQIINLPDKTHAEQIKDVEKALEDCAACALLGFEDKDDFENYEGEKAKHKAVELIDPPNGFVEQLTVFKPAKMRDMSFSPAFQDSKEDMTFYKALERIAAGSMKAIKEAKMYKIRGFQQAGEIFARNYAGTSGLLDNHQITFKVGEAAATAQTIKKMLTDLKDTIKVKMTGIHAENMVVAKGQEKFEQTGSKVIETTLTKCVEVTWGAPVELEAKFKVAQDYVDGCTFTDETPKAKPPLIKAASTGMLLNSGI